MSEDIADLHARLRVLEEAIFRAAVGESIELALSHDDALGSIEVGVSTLAEALCGRVEEVERANRELDERVAERTRELQGRLDELSRQAELIERQRDAIDRLSTPILQLWTQIIALPLIGIVDSTRAAELSERLLAAVAKGNARYVILDLTGVEVVDTGTAAHLLELVRATQLLGSRCVLTGVQPVVARTMVALGVDFGDLVIGPDLQAGLKACLREMERDGA